MRLLPLVPEPDNAAIVASAAVPLGAERDCVVSTLRGGDLIVMIGKTLLGHLMNAGARCRPVASPPQFFANVSRGVIIVASGRTARASHKNLSPLLSFPG